MIRYGKYNLPSERMDGEFLGTTVWGWICEGGIIEAFATNPSASGTSDAMLGKFHESDRVLETSQSRFNAAYLIHDSVDNMDDTDKNLSLGELNTKYPTDN